MDDVRRVIAAEVATCLPSVIGFAMRFGRSSNAGLDMAYGCVWCSLVPASLPTKHLLWTQVSQCVKHSVFFIVERSGTALFNASCATTARRQGRVSANHVHQATSAFHLISVSHLLLAACIMLAAGIPCMLTW